MKNLVITGLIALFGATIWSCNQNQTVSPDTNISAARLSADSTGFFCRDSLTKIEVSALPATVTSYISTSYAGATIDYAATDDAGNFLVAITQNDQRKALLFNADGSFNKELSLRGGGKDRGGKGHGGKGGKGGDRDSLTRVTVANLPTAITSYITTNYASATIVTAALDATRGYLVMIKQGTDRKTLLFGTDGTFTQEIVRGLGKDYTTINASALPTAVTSYITTKYAGATIKVAGKSSTGQFKVVIQPTSGRTIELLFAADGTFVQARKGR
ncbi:PepSY-like domain-containing protein [Spirosoma validum]|uniref:PepSY-like domain-containing protein n=1 Tax=Spirosoma validum TaxID=2771355 RepID=A0A927B9X5_9BACT|nr:PepSY-like domain-containing protein [Spirosoma validum]MBD2757861.1 PepSY-like domain-containing protein [Spirosoma validum]